MLDKIIMSLSTGVLRLDADGIIQEFNPAVEKLLGIEPEHQQQLPDYINSVHAISESGDKLLETWPLEKMFNDKKSTIVLLPDNDGNYKKRIEVQFLSEESAAANSHPDLYIIFDDITNKKSHDETSSRAGKYKSARSAIHFGVWEHDVVTEEVYWSKEIYYLFYRDMELGPPNYSEFTFSIHPEDRYEVDERFQRSLIEGVSCNMNYRTNPMIGPMRYLNTQFSCILSNNQVVKIYGSNLDLTDSRILSKSLGKSDSKLPVSTGGFKIGYWEYDIASDMFTFRDSFYEFLGTTVNKMGGYKISSSRYTELFIPPEDAMIIGNEALKGLQSKETHYSNVINHGIIYADGSKGVVESHIFMVKDKEGKTVKAYGIIRDITNEQNP